MLSAQVYASAMPKEGSQMATTVRIDEQLAKRLRKLAIDEQRPIGQVIRDALEQYEKEKFWQEVEESAARLHADPDAWQDYQQEIHFFQGGSMDGLKDEEPYYSDAEWEEIVEQRSRTKGG